MSVSQSVSEPPADLEMLAHLKIYSSVTSCCLFTHFGYISRRALVLASRSTSLKHRVGAFIGCQKCEMVVSAGTSAQTAPNANCLNTTPSEDSWMPTPLLQWSRDEDQQQTFEQQSKLNSCRNYTSSTLRKVPQKKCSLNLVFFQNRSDQKHF